MAAFTRIEARPEGAGANRWYRVALKEGRNREVRRMFEAVGGRVSTLRRTRYGPIELPRDLRAGEWRELAPERVRELFAT
jgi:23S rRNA pseudouridine2605 synthase